MAGDPLDDPALAHFARLPLPMRVVYARPRTFFAIVCALVSYFLLPGELRLITRLLLAWDIFTTLYLTLVVLMMMRCEHHRIRRDAIKQDDGRFVILLVTALGAFA